MEDGIILQVKNAYYAFEDSLKKYNNAQFAVKQAEKNLNIREARFQSGVEKTTDLLNANSEFEKAATASLDSHFNILKAIENLKYSTGLNIQAIIK